MESQAFETTITGMHSILIPNDIATSFIDNDFERVKVIARFKGNTVEFHAALQKDASGIFRITCNQKLQKALGVFRNDYFILRLKGDHSKYGVDMPEELEAVLDSDPKAFKIFEDFTAGKKRSIIYSILRYRQSQTRIDKSLLLCENLNRGITDQNILLRKN